MLILKASALANGQGVSQGKLVLVLRDFVYFLPRYIELLRL